MQFSNTTTNLGMIQMYERYTGLGIASVSGVTARLQEATGYLNMANRKAWSAIFLSYGGWQYEDSNQTNLPIATASLSSGQATYALPSGATTVSTIEVLNTGGTWEALTPVTNEMIKDSGSISGFTTSNGTPRYYTLVGQTITLYPPPNYSQASSLRVWYDRGAFDFVQTDTTATGGLDSNFHDILPLDAAITYLSIYEPNSNKIGLFKQDRDRMLLDIKSVYAQRYKDMFPPKIMVRDALREAM